MKAERILLVLIAILSVIAAALENQSLGKEIICYANGILMFPVAGTQLKKSRLSFWIAILAGIFIFSLGIMLHNR